MSKQIFKVGLLEQKKENFTKGTALLMTKFVEISTNVMLIRNITFVMATLLAPTLLEVTFANAMMALRDVVVKA